MTRLLCSTALIFALPGWALAQDMTLRAEISEAVVNAQGAEITRAVAVTLPAGETRLFIAMPDAGWADLVQMTGPDGVRFSAVERVGEHRLADGALDTPAQAAARQAVEEAEEALLRTQDEIAGAEAEIRAVEAQLAYLNALTRGDGGVAMPEDPALVPQFLATLGTEMRRVIEALSATRSLRRELSDRITERQEALDAAEAALERLRPFGDTVDGLEVTATTGAEVEAVLTLTYLSDGVYWEPSYDLRLDSASGAMSLERHIALSVGTPARWDSVDVSFSTATPSRQRVPQEVWSRPARIMEPPTMRAASGEVMDSAMVEPLPLAPVVMAEGRAAMVVDGLSVRYDYATPVSVGASGEVMLSLDTLDFDMATENRAAPRFDDTAFLMALGENDTGEPILPGEARFYRDGALVGEDWIELIPAGAQMELAFGALDHLQLVWIDRTNAEGDRGVFVTSNTQARSLSFGVENTSDQPEPVRVIYATPFVEQDDLEMDLTLTPLPSALNVEDRRGVHAWSVIVGPGETAMVDMEVEFTWPEDQILDWRP
jgi:uncharacterized protein (TIGR02231 family)